MNCRCLLSLSGPGVAVAVPSVAAANPTRRRLGGVTGEPAADDKSSTNLLSFLVTVKLAECVPVPAPSPYPPTPFGGRPQGDNPEGGQRPKVDGPEGHRPQPVGPL